MVGMKRLKMDEISGRARAVQAWAAGPATAGLGGWPALLQGPSTAAAANARSTGGAAAEHRRTAKQHEAAAAAPRQQAPAVAPRCALLLRHAAPRCATPWLRCVHHLSSSNDFLSRELVKPETTLQQGNRWNSTRAYFTVCSPAQGTAGGKQRGAPHNAAAGNHGRNTTQHHTPHCALQTHRWAPPAVNSPEDHLDGDADEHDVEDGAQAKAEHGVEAKACGGMKGEAAGHATAVVQPQAGWAAAHAQPPARRRGPATLWPAKTAADIRSVLLRCNVGNAVELKGRGLGGKATLELCPTYRQTWACPCRSRQTRGER